MKQERIINSKMTRILLIAAGFFCVGLGVLGIFLPVLPTVPFLLLAAACFARSSDRFYGWLTGHPRFGPLIHGYLNGQGMPFKAKVSAIVMIWLTLSLSVFLLADFLLIQVFLIAIGLCLTLYLLRLPAMQKLGDE